MARNPYQHLPYFPTSAAPPLLVPPLVSPVVPQVVFPIGAYRKEFAADHLDRLLGKSILDRFIQKSSVTENRHAGGTDQPEHRGDGRGPNTKGHRDDQQTRVELGGVETRHSKVQITTLQFPDSEKTTGDDDDNEQEKRVGQQAVDAEHDKHDGIVAREVGQVVVDTALDLAEVGRLGQTLKVEELGNWTQVGKARAKGLGAKAVKAVPEAGGNGVDGNLHGEWRIEEVEEVEEIEEIKENKVSKKKKRERD